MRNIKFIETGMINFGPYVDQMVLKFQDDQLTLIVGPNGVGKTMALDSIPFTLFGVTSKGLKADDVVNNVTNKNCYTWVEFYVDSDKYIVKRYQKYHKFGGTNVILNKNGVDIKQGARDVHPEIERLICPQKGFMNTLMFGQKVKDFFTDLTDSKQKEIFRKLLGLDNYVDYYKEADTRIKGLSSGVQDTRQQIIIKKELLKEVYSQIAVFEQAKKDFETKKQQALKDMEKNKRDLEKFMLKHIQERDELLTKDREPEKIEIEWNKLLNDLTTIDMEISRKELDINSKKEAKLHELQQTAEKKKAEVSSQAEVEKDKIISDWRAKEKEINEKIGDAKDHENELKSQVQELTLNSQHLQHSIEKINESVFEAEISTCPICHQAITDHTKQDLENEIKESENTIMQNMSKANDLIEEIDVSKKIRFDLEKSKRDLDAEAGGLLNDLDASKKEKIRELEGRLQEVSDMVEIQAINEVNDMKGEMAGERERIVKVINEIKAIYEVAKKNAENLKFLEDNIKSCENGIKTIDEQYKRDEASQYDETELNHQKGRANQFLYDINELQNSIQDDERNLEITEFWKAAYSPTGIPSMLTDEAIPFMNEKVSEYLESLSNGRYIVSFDTQDTIKSGEIRDKISVNVLDTYTRANQRKQLSGGQTRLVDIATILTLGDLQANNLGINVNLLIFDEIFDSLDEQNIDYVSKVLSRLKKGRSIYLISHRHQDQLEADNILEIRS
jgi:DNA repair exonuclease SbcCD ATPase subunit